MKTKRAIRLLAVLLSLVMVVGIMPITAFATQNTVYQNTPDNLPEAVNETTDILVPAVCSTVTNITGTVDENIVTVNYSLSKKNAAANVGDTSETPYYGLSKLTDTNLKDAYAAICAGVASKNTIINLLSYDITIEQFNKVLELYIFDHSEHYWFPNDYSLVLYGDKVYSIELPYLTGFDDDLFATEANKLLEAADGKSSDYDKALALHDALVKHIVYDDGATNAHNVYGAIVDGRAVCEGYAESYQYLLQKVGIQSYIVTGASKGEGHEWNLVRLDNNYYYTDVTWDDPIFPSEDDTKPIFYPYFNITTQRLTEDHTIVDTYDVLPICNLDDKMYTDYAKLSEYSADAVAAAFKTSGSQKIARIYYTGTDDNFGEWWNINYIDVATIIKISAGSFSSLDLGREHYVIFKPTATFVTVSGTLTGWDNTDNARYYLYSSTISDDNIKADVKSTTPTGTAVTERGAITLNSDGKRYDQTFSFGSVSAGTYKLAIYKPGKYVVKVISITVGASDYNVNTNIFSGGECKLWLYGDVNYDGNVNITDATQIQRYFADKTSKFTDGTTQDISDRLEAANVTALKNDDTAINITDATQIQRYFAEKTSVFDVIQ